MRKPVYYKVFDKDELIGEFTASQISRKIHIQENTLKHYVSHGLLFKGRYTFERGGPECELQKEDPRFIEKFTEEWNAVCMLFRKSNLKNKK